MDIKMVHIIPISEDQLYAELMEDRKYYICSNGEIRRMKGRDLLRGMAEGTMKFMNIASNNLLQASDFINDVTCLRENEFIYLRGSNITAIWYNNMGWYTRKRTSLRIDYLNPLSIHNDLVRITPRTIGYNDFVRELIMG